MQDFGFIQDFILPSLEGKSFGYLLEWQDRQNGVFKVFWSHKSGRKWNREHFLVFISWDERKGRPEQNTPAFYTDSKGRFRSALTRLKPQIKYLGKSDGYRVYQLKSFSRLTTTVIKSDTNKKTVEEIKPIDSPVEEIKPIDSPVEEIKPIDSPVSVESYCSSDSGIGSDVEFPDEIFSPGSNDNFQSTVIIEPQNTLSPIQYSDNEGINSVIVSNNETGILNDSCENLLNPEMLPAVMEYLNDEYLLNEIDLEFLDSTMNF